MEKPLFSSSLLIDAVKAIEISRRRMAVVVDKNFTVIGTLTDGDIRRHILGGGDLNDSVVKAMNTSPITTKYDSPYDYIKHLMQNGNILAIPLVDDNKKFIRLIHLTDLKEKESELEIELGFSFAVIMAGGEGARLRPLTNSIPKPMVDIGGAPLLERQIKRLVDVGIPRVYISVNYLAHIIEDYFKDGEDFNIEIFYLKEQEKLGTAGSLTLLPEIPIRPILVMNGDILTTSNLNSFYNFHESHSADITLAAIDYRIAIPYGVVKTKEGFVSELIEKPSERFLCNAGIYVLSPRILNLLPKNKFSDMTDLVEICIEKKNPVAVFPVHEYWNDIGTHDDLSKARQFISGFN